MKRFHVEVFVWGVWTKSPAMTREEAIAEAAEARRHGDKARITDDEGREVQP